MKHLGHLGGYSTGDRIVRAGGEEQGGLRFVQHGPKQRRRYVGLQRYVEHARLEHPQNGGDQLDALLDQEDDRRRCLAARPQTMRQAVGCPVQRAVRPGHVAHRDGGTPPVRCHLPHEPRGDRLLDLGPLEGHVGLA